MCSLQDGAAADDLVVASTSGENNDSEICAQIALGSASMMEEQAARAAEGHQQLPLVTASVSSAPAQSHEGEGEQGRGRPGTPAGAETRSTAEGGAVGGCNTGGILSCIAEDMVEESAGDGVAQQARSCTRVEVLSYASGEAVEESAGDDEDAQQVELSTESPLPSGTETAAVKVKVTGSAADADSLHSDGKTAAVASKVADGSWQGSEPQATAALVSDPSDDRLSTSAEGQSVA